MHCSFLKAGNTFDPVKAIQECWTLDDINLKVRENQKLNYTELISDRVFVEPAVEQFCLKSLAGSKELFSYFITDFSLNGKQSPYAFVSTDGKTLRKSNDRERLAGRRSGR